MISTLNLICLASILALCSAVSITQYDDASCTQLSKNDIIFSTNPWECTIGECKAALNKTYKSAYSLRVDKCEGSDYEATPFPNGCGGKPGPVISSPDVGKCVGGNGKYYKIVC